jgi:predicted  nucleic acid-binding Zn-ribbon protein
MEQLDSIPTGEWECAECGYIEKGVETRRPKRCPECDAPASALEFFPYDEDDEEDWGRDAEDEEDEEDEDDLEDGEIEEY